MALLVRKITSDYWVSVPSSEDPGTIKACVLRGKCLKTNKKSEISLWEFRPDEWENAILAVLYPGAEKLESIDLVWLEEQTLREYKLEIIKSKPNLPIKDLLDRHYDAVNINLSALSRLAKHLLDRVNLNDPLVLRTITKGEIVMAFKNALRDGRISREKLKGEMLAAVNT
jgi:hypothetical protein